MRLSLAIIFVLSAALCVFAVAIPELKREALMDRSGGTAPDTKRGSAQNAPDGMDVNESFKSLFSFYTRITTDPFTLVSSILIVILPRTTILCSSPSFLYVSPVF
ncbi:hypothetical protein HD554DRAFT_1830018 [Boletus coccyginus]|nr:hypothetical protein HD554DRAFT_1830018 [Boletus coccyginus]